MLIIEEIPWSYPSAELLPSFHCGHTIVFCLWPNLSIHANTWHSSQAWTTDCFHCQFIGRLFSQLTGYLLCLWKVWKWWKMLIRESHSPTWLPQMTCFVHIQFTVIEEWINQKILHLGSWNLKLWTAYFPSLKKYSNWLINYQNTYCCNSTIYCLIDSMINLGSLVNWLVD